MTIDSLNAFFRAADEDVDLERKVKSASSAIELVKIAHKAGFPISIEDIKGLHSDLSDDDLEGVAGCTSLSEAQQMPNSVTAGSGLLTGLSVDEARNWSKTYGIKF